MFEPKVLNTHPTPLAPWDVAAHGMLPSVPGDDLRASSVHLGRWWSPDGFPWEVCLVRTDWWSLPDEGAPEGPGPLPAPVAPMSFLLVPRPIAAPPQQLLTEYEAWLGKPASQRSSWSPSSTRYVWRLAEPWPGDLRATWNETVLAARAVAAEVGDEATGPALKSRWNLTPWVFLLHADLVAAIRRALKLPGGLDGLDIVHSGRGASLRSGWLSGVVPTRKRRATDHWIRSSAYDLLIRDGCSKQAAAAFLDGEADKDALISASETSKRYSDWRARLGAGGVQPYLVPLTGHRVYDDEQDLVQWTCRWLVDGEAAHALWLLFGRSIRYFRWRATHADHRPGAVSGLRALEDGLIGAFSETKSSLPYGLELDWRPPPAATAEAHADGS